MRALYRARARMIIIVDAVTIDDGWRADVVVVLWYDRQVKGLSRSLLIGCNVQ